MYEQYQKTEDGRTVSAETRNEKLCSRACLYASLEDKDGEVAVQEFRRTVTDCHPDSSDLPVAYAWLAKILLENKSLGTYELAETYWKKSRQAAARYTELYGKVSKSAIEDEMKELFGAVDPLGSVVESWEKEGIGNLDKSRGCFACGRAASVTGGNLLRSSQCRNEFYCSSQCQQDVSLTSCRSRLPFSKTYT